METMNKFKAGNEIVRINNLRDDIKIGFKTIVRAGYCYKTPLGQLVDIIDRNWELANPKWTIYNNTLPWSELSDKQKGKLLLAGNEGVEMTLDGDIVNDAAFKCKKGVYKAIKPEPVKPEPVKPESKMANLLMVDLSQCQDGDLISHLINRGWTKSCK
jgi:hypothetical protein